MQNHFHENIFFSIFNHKSVEPFVTLEGLQMNKRNDEEGLSVYTDVYFMSIPSVGVCQVRDNRRKEV